MDAWWQWQAGGTSACCHTSACSCRAVCTHVAAGQFQRPAAVASSHTDPALQLLHIYSIYQMNSAQAVPGLGALRAGLGKGCKLRRTLCSATAHVGAAKLAQTASQRLCTPTATLRIPPAALWVSTAAQGLGWRALSGATVWARAPGAARQHQQATSGLQQQNDVARAAGAAGGGVQRRLPRLLRPALAVMGT